jgi:protein SCO1
MTEPFRDVRALASMTALRVSAALSGQSGSPYTFPDVGLITDDNRPVRFYTDLVKGRTALINFMFTSCEGFCPITIPHLVETQQLLGPRVGRDIFLYSITLDPVVDAPPVLADYKKKMGVGPGWTFLTASEAVVTRLRRRLGVYSRDPKIDADRTQHSGIVVYGNDSLQRWASISGLYRGEVIVKAVLRVAGPPQSI